MREVVIVNTDHPFDGPLRAGYCVSYMCRLRGLSLRRTILESWGLLLVYQGESRLDTAIHMLGMNFDLGIVWINSAGEVVDLRYARRWRSFIMPSAAAKYVLEILPQRLKDFNLRDKITFEEII